MRGKGVLLVIVVALVAAGVPSVTSPAAGEPGGAEADARTPRSDVGVPVLDYETPDAAPRYAPDRDPGPPVPMLLPMRMPPLDGLVPVRASSTPPPRTPHAPILLDSDAAFAGPAAVSGVVGGSGTAEDPYVVSGWLFEVDGTPGVEIRGTRAHVVLRDNVFAAVSATYRAGEATGGWLQFAHDPRVETGIVLAGAENVTVEANWFLPLQHAVSALDGAVLSFVENDVAVGLRGLHAVDVRDVRVEGNTFRGGVVGVSTWSAEDVVLQGNTFDGAVVGSDAWNVGKLVARENAYTGGLAQAIDESGGGSRWEANTFDDALSTHLRLMYGSVATVCGNGFAGAPYALFMFGSSGNTIEDNVFRDHVAAIDVRFSVENAASRNAITGTFSPVLGMLRQRFDRDTNVADGRPILFLRNATDEVVDLGGGSVAGVLAHASSGLVLRNGEVRGQGVALERSSGARIEDVTVSGVYWGLQVSSSEDVVLAGVEVTDCILGVVLVQAHRSRVEDASVARCVAGVVVLSGTTGAVLERVATRETVDGIHLGSGTRGTLVASSLVEQSERNGIAVLRDATATLLDNRVRASGHGLLLFAAEHVVARRNVLSDSRYDVDVLHTFAHDLDETNLVRGLPLRLLHDANGVVLEPTTVPAGWLALVRPVDVTVTGYDLGRNGDGVVLVDPVRTRVVSNRLSENVRGVTVLGNTADVVVEGNAIVGNYGAFSLHPPAGAYAIHGNDVVGTWGYLVSVATGGEVDARENWWGTPLGPPAYFWRSVNGRLTAEVGPYRVTSTFLPVNEDVAFAPWSVEPHGAPAPT